MPCASRLAGKDKALGVSPDVGLAEPFGIGVGADEGKKVTYRPFGFLAGVEISPSDMFKQAALAFQIDQVRTGDQGDITQRANAFDQVARHLRLKTGGADHKPDLFGVAGQENDGLAGGVSTAGQDDFLIFAKLCFQR